MVLTTVAIKSCRSCLTNNIVVTKPQGNECFCITPKINDSWVKHK